ncbi:MAG: RagB/SusD family nutrient uptake outer membrane protein [Prevotella sp.]|nr:RagB/SusD family nutrient uptake outer membrane protein [Prevotella sp.]
MKKYIYSAVAALTLAMGFMSCGDDFLDTKYYKGVDAEGSITNAELATTALTGVYSNLYTRYFAGNYATSIGDIPTDLAYWNTKTGHWDGIYQYSFQTTDTYLSYIWEYGYKIVDNAARVIDAATDLYEDATDDDKEVLDVDIAEAYALRAYANLILVNVFGHQVKVNGTDYSSQPGVVISEKPIPAFSQVERSTVGQVYDFIVSDLNKSIEHFNAAGGDRGDANYFTVASVKGLQARVNLYLENWAVAASKAQEAIDEAGAPALAYTASAYKALYNGGASNTESIFYLDINANQNWSANSCGTLWTTYSFSPSPKLLSLYADTDVRTSIMDFDNTSTETVPVYAGGKFSHYSSGNPAYATNYLVNVPEMYLIIAESKLKSGDAGAARTALLNVAKRNTAITSVDDLPQTDSELYAFIKDERARELFQEGLRLYDLRRWGGTAQVVAYNAPSVAFRYANYDISKLVFPIPEDEINAGFGVAQTEGWEGNLPE